MSSLARDFFYFLASSSFKYHSSMFNFWPKIRCVQFMWFFDCVSLGPFQWFFFILLFFIFYFYFYFIASPLGPVNDYFYISLFLISIFYYYFYLLFIIASHLGPFNDYSGGKPGTKYFIYRVSFHLAFAKSSRTDKK